MFDLWRLSGIIGICIASIFTYNHRLVFPLVHVPPYVFGQGDIHGVDGAERRFQNYLSGWRRRGGTGGSGAEHAYGCSPGRRRATVARRRSGTLVQRSVQHAPRAGHHSQSVHVGFIWIPRKFRARSTAALCVFWKIGRFRTIIYYIIYLYYNIAIMCLAVPVM